MATGTCTACGTGVPLWAARPRVLADGRVEIQCASCESGLTPIAAAIDPPTESHVIARRMRRPGAVVAAVSALGATAIAALVASGALEHASAASTGGLAAIGDDVGESVAPEVPLPPGVAATPPPPPPLPPIPEKNGEPLDEWYPTLLEWTHPVPGSPDVLPRTATRVFGAHRSDSDNDCGGGHCGVDLEGEMGQPVVAVAWGLVSRIQTEDVGHGGRYVRIEHPDFVYTSYFHLDRIAPGLEVGMEIEPGDVVGTVGQTGRAAMPHLHFALEIPDRYGGSTFIDPAPFLARATVIDRDAVPALRRR